MKKLLLVILLGFVWGNISILSANTTTTTESKEEEVVIDNLYDLYKNDGTYITPSIGDVNGIVVPVCFEKKTDEHINELKSTLDINFNSTSTMSVSRYYKLSSYNKLNFSFDIFDAMYTKENLSFYEKAGSDKGTEYLVNEFYQNYQNKIDMNKYDLNNDGYVDALYLIYDYNYDEKSDFLWAYSTTFDLPKHEYIPVSQYVFMSAKFFRNNDASTAIHETGHLLGIDDYYDYNPNVGPNGGLGNHDIMDASYGDHNPISKLLLGWIEPTIINYTTNFTLDDFCSSGEVLILTLEDKFSLFSEFIIIDYLDYSNPNSLNNYNIPSNIGFPVKQAIRVQKIDARISDAGKAGDYYSLFNSDNSDTVNRFVEIIEKDNNNTIETDERISIDDFFYKHDILSSTRNTQLKTSNGLEYNFEVKVNDFNVTNKTASLLITFYDDTPKALVFNMPEVVEVRRGETIRSITDLIITDYQGNQITDYTIIGDYNKLLVGTYKMGVKAVDSEGNIGIHYFDLVVTNRSSFDMASNVVYICILIVVCVGIAGYLKVSYDKKYSNKKY